MPYTSEWWVRGDADGVINGAAFVASYGGTNLANQTSAALVRTDLATPSAGSTTLTSAGGGFTSQMVGNGIYIASGTNFTVGWYLITAFVSSTQVTLHESPSPSAAGSSGTGRVGGASKVLTISGVVGGNTVWVRGDGNDDPSTASFTVASYITPTGGSLAGGAVRLRGFFGRPLITGPGMLLYDTAHMIIERMAFRLTAVGSFPAYGMVYTKTDSIVRDCIFDQAGYDHVGVGSGLIDRCIFKNTGTTTAGTYPAITLLHHSSRAFGNRVTGWRGHGIGVSAQAPQPMPQILRNIITGCKLGGIRIGTTSGSQYFWLVLHNIIHGNDGPGIQVDNAATGVVGVIANNIIASNSGYGLSLPSGLSLRNRLHKNAWYGNTSGLCNEATTNEQIVSPGHIMLGADPFVNAAAGDFTLTTTAAAALNGQSDFGWTNIDIGAAQHADPRALPRTRPLRRIG